LQVIVSDQEDEFVLALYVGEGQAVRLLSVMASHTAAQELYRRTAIVADPVATQHMAEFQERWEGS
jgi:hypothetical protein